MLLLLSTARKVLSIPGPQLCLLALVRSSDVKFQRVLGLLRSMVRLGNLRLQIVVAGVRFRGLTSSVSRVTIGAKSQGAYYELHANACTQVSTKSPNHLRASEGSQLVKCTSGTCSCLFRVEQQMLALLKSGSYPNAKSPFGKERPSKPFSQNTARADVSTVGSS